MFAFIIAFLVGVAAALLTVTLMVLIKALSIATLLLITLSVISALAVLWLRK